MAEGKITTAAMRRPRATAGTPVCAELQAELQAELHAAGFQRARADRRTALAEDYVELIADMIDRDGAARQVEIAARLGVTQPTVAKMLKRLHGDRLVTCTPYRGVALTEAGRQLAVRSRERHRLVEAFLLSLGVSPEAARCDAEGIEHHVSRETLDAFAEALGRPPVGADAA